VALISGTVAGAVAAGGAPTEETVVYVANVTALWRELRGCH
jgi:hypothetical protein